MIELFAVVTPKKYRVGLVAVEYLVISFSCEFRRRA